MLGTDSKITEIPNTLSPPVERSQSTWRVSRSPSVDNIRPCCVFVFRVRLFFSRVNATQFVAFDFPSSSPSSFRKSRYPAFLCVLCTTRVRAINDDDIDYAIIEADIISRESVTPLAIYLYSLIYYYFVCIVYYFNYL